MREMYGQSPFFFHLGLEEWEGTEELTESTWMVWIDAEYHSWHWDERPKALQDAERHASEGGR